MKKKTFTELPQLLKMDSERWDCRLSMWSNCYYVRGNHGLATSGIGSIFIPRTYLFRQTARGRHESDSGFYGYSKEIFSPDWGVSKKNIRYSSSLLFIQKHMNLKDLTSLHIKIKNTQLFGNNTCDHNLTLGLIFDGEARHPEFRLYGPFTYLSFGPMGSILDAGRRSSKYFDVYCPDKGHDMFLVYFLLKNK